MKVFALNLDSKGILANYESRQFLVSLASVHGVWLQVVLEEEEKITRWCNKKTEQDKLLPFIIGRKE